MRLILAILAFYLGYATYANADNCTEQCPVNSGNSWAYNQADHFRWNDWDTDLHVAIGFGGTLLLSEVLTRKFDVSPWKAAIMSSVIVGLTGTTKEVMFDTYTSRTDIKSYWGGSLVAATTFVVINF